jgi:predicted DsbA family dithiol-disulfide isomerase
LEALEKSHGVTVRWRSFELRPEGTTIPPEYLARIEAMRPRLYQMAREQYGLELNSGPMGIDSRPALIGGKYAEAQGVGEAYHDAVFAAYWLHAQSIEETAVLADIAQSIGLEREAFLAALADERWETAVDADIHQAHMYGLTAVPALVFGGKYLVSGAQPYPVLVQVTEQLLSENGA